MMPKHQGMPAIDNAGPLQAPRGNQARAPAFAGLDCSLDPTADRSAPAANLRKSLLLVAKSSRQVNDVMVVSSVSTRTLIE
jgi:hypothetical protein